MMTDMKERLAKAVRQRGRIGQRNLWPYVDDKGGWVVRIIGLDEAGDNDYLDCVFTISQIWKIGRRTTCYSAHGFFTYAPSSLHIVDCPERYKHLL